MLFAHDERKLSLGKGDFNFKAIYLIPTLGIGGVERAAQTIYEPKHLKGRFSLQTISKRENKIDRIVRIHLIEYLKCIISLLTERPTILIVSLWRACLVGLTIKIIRPRTKLVVFLHFPEAAHGVDFLITLLSTLFASAIWVDSKKTAERTGVITRNGSPRVISFVTQKLEPRSSPEVVPVFIFWGRLHAQKNLLGTLALFKRIVDAAPLAQPRLYIIGPDGGERSKLIAAIRRMGLVDKVNLVGQKSFAEIRDYVPKASFYLQTSKMEGMAMSVVEAMQLGLVPVVTPVGEIEYYAIDGVNAVLVRNYSETADQIISLLGNQVAYQQLRNKAIDTWSSAQLYTDSFFSELYLVDRS